MCQVFYFNSIQFNWALIRLPTMDCFVEKVYFCEPIVDLQLQGYSTRQLFLFLNTVNKNWGTNVWQNQAQILPRWRPFWLKRLRTSFPCKCRHFWKRSMVTGEVLIYFFCICFRLGGDASDAHQIKKHPFFENTVWEDVLNKKVPHCFPAKIWRKG